MQKLTHIAFLCGIVISLSGCFGGQSQGVEAGRDGTQTSGIDGQSAIGADENRQIDSAALLDQRRVHFDFDSSEIDPESRAVVEAHAEYLANNPDINITLEGHCDERGTREYNLALGERRSQAVARVMKLLGVQNSRITNVSYGEEKPLIDAHNEEAWRENRRVEIIY